MTDFNFEANTRNYSRKNAYWLGKASQLAYKSKEEGQAEISNWGLTEFEFFELKDTQAFIAGNNEMLILAFRGTSDLRDWMTDADAALVNGPKGKVHDGFNTALSYVWRDISGFIREKRQGRALWVTGHSLGAAVGTLAVARFRLEKNEPVNGLYTFGQPRTGNWTFAKNFDKDFEAQTFRYVHNNDIVTRVPFRAMGYSHVGTFRYFDENGNQRDNIDWWDKIKDRLKGRVNDFLELGTDGIKDHFMDNYVRCLEKAIK
ncbi:MAG: lipase family protein [Nitrospirota bacterium]